AVLFEALTGKRAFGGEDEGDIALGILLADIPSASSIVPSIPPALDAVVTKALARDREERFQTALEFQVALERASPPPPARDVARVAETVGQKLFELRRVALQEAMSRSVGPVIVEAALERTSTVKVGPSRKVFAAAAVMAVLLLYTAIRLGATTAQTTRPAPP